MWTILLLIAGFLLNGCSQVTSVFDPSPYDPTLTENENLQGDHKLNTQTILFESYPPNPSPNQQLLIHSANKLQFLSISYATQRNYTMQGELIFDVPILGLSIARWHLASLKDRKIKFLLWDWREQA
jgi:hypothetical protein